jgi:hypothetical protein
VRASEKLCDEQLARLELEPEVSRTEAESERAQLNLTFREARNLDRIRHLRQAFAELRTEVEVEPGRALQSRTSAPELSVVGAAA